MANPWTTQRVEGDRFADRSADSEDRFTLRREAGGPWIGQVSRRSGQESSFVTGIDVSSHSLHDCPLTEFDFYVIIRL